MIRAALGVSVVSSVGLAFVLAFAATTIGGLRSGDQALAERLTLRLSDLPKGWAAEPSNPRDDYTCVPKEFRNANGETESAEFKDRNAPFRVAGSGTSVYASVALAKRAQTYFRSPAFAGCFRTQVRKLVGEGWDWRVARVAFRPSCRSQKRCPFVTDKVRVTGQVRGVSVYYDFVTVQRGRAALSFSFVDLVNPFSSRVQEAVVTTVMRRY